MAAGNKKKIIVTDWDQNWTNEFDKLKDHIEKCIKPFIIDIIHIGSTSIRGLASKPIIDMVIVGKLKNFEKVKKGLKSLDYFHNGDQGIRGREVFKLPDDQKRNFYPHHLYYCDPESSELRRYFSFLSYLRDNPVVVQEYGTIKKKGAQLYPYDIMGYLDHKGNFLATHLAIALKKSGDLPKLTRNHCNSCFSHDIESEFFISYIGDGYKEEKYRITCNNCHSESTIDAI